MTPSATSCLILPVLFSSEEPGCLFCNGIVRPDVTLYGEFLPQEAYSNAIEMINAADCLIIGGTSLEVGSAAQLALGVRHSFLLYEINSGKYP